MKKQFERPVLPAMKIPEIYRAKWPLALLGEGFMPLAKTALRSMAKILQGPEAIEDLAILLVIIDYQRPNLQWKPSLEYLAFTAGTSDSEAQDSLTRLEEKGLITVEKAFEDRLEINPYGFYRAIEKLTLSSSPESLPGLDHEE